MVRHSSVHQEIIGRKFDLLQTVRTSLSPDPPWDSIIDFACHPYFCGQRLYPKQRTFLKLAHLETENMTSFDIDTIEEWREGFLNHQEVAGVQPDVWERVGWLKERGYRHFSEILSIIGRRGSKGVVGGILGAEKIAYFYWLDNWQQHFGLKPHSDGYLSVIATTFEQAKKFQFNDIKLVVEGCRYLQPAISTDKEHYLSIRTPTDEAYIAELLARGVPVEREIASIKAQAFSANSASSRGGAMFSSFYDEFAHQITGTGSNKTGEEIYNAGQPSLKQFKKSAFTYIPSTPFSQIGKLFELYNVGTNLMPYGDEVKASQEAIELGEEPIFTEEEKGRPVAEVYQEKTLVVDPSKLIIQLPSWGLYEGYDKSTKIPMFSKAYFEKSKRWTKNKGNYIKEAVTSYDEQMMITERANPEAFRVEHRAQFAPVEGAYLSVAKIKQMFEDPGWRPLLSQQSHGIPLYRYRIHCDPGRTGANFALAIGHVETAPPDEHGHVWEHVVIDVLRVWRPMDYADGIVDYVQVQQEIRQILLDFPSTFKLSMDQWNSASLLAHLQKEFSPRIRITEDTFTESVNQNRFEDFKTILNLGWIHSYRDSLYKDNTNCLLELELKFLQEKNGKVVKQEVGPVTTKDLCDAVMTVACDLLRDNLIRFADLTGSAYGSSNFRGIESGTELERQNALGLGSTQNATSKARSRLHENQLDRARGRARDISRGYSRSRGR